MRKEGSHTEVSKENITDWIWEIIALWSNEEYFFILIFPIVILLKNVLYFLTLLCLLEEGGSMFRNSLH